MSTDPVDVIDTIASQAFPEKWQQDLLHLGNSIAVIETLTLLRTQGAAAVASSEAARAEAASLRQELRGMQEQISSCTAEYGRMLEAFPNGDLELHKKAHQVINLRKEFWQKMCNIALENAVKGTTWAFLVAVALALWEFFKSRVKE